MTHEEAIEILKAEYLGDSENMKMAKRVAVSALDKQIPKNPVVKKIGDDIKLNYCPCCNVRFFRAGFKYCGECGQSLEWSDWSDGE